MKPKFDKVEDCCPTCKRKEYLTIGVSSSSEYCSLVMQPSGSVVLRMCLNCGTVYISGFELERARRLCKK